MEPEEAFLCTCAYLTGTSLPMKHVTLPTWRGSVAQAGGWGRMELRAPSSSPATQQPITEAHNSVAARSVMFAHYTKG